MIKIEKNVPIPDRGERCGYRPTMRNMDVGDSALFIGSYSSIGSTAYVIFGAGNYRLKTENGGLRVWRIK